MPEVNPLFTPFDTAPFSQIKDAHYKPAFLAALDEARSEIAQISDQEAAPSFANTIEALEYSGQHLDRLTSLFFNLNSANTTEAIQALAQEISPMLAEFSNDITLNTKLFHRVKAVYESRETLNLSPEQHTLLEKKYKHFARNGANLSEEKKKRLREIDKTLAKRKLSFGENVLAETNKYELHLSREADLAGLPEGVVEGARLLAESRKKDGWLFTLDYPSYLPFMKYAQNRDLRKQLYLTFASKGFHGDTLDNTDLVLEIARLRFERAQLLGYPTHAHFVLEERMADTPEKVMEFLHELLEKAKPAAMQEFQELEEFAKSTGEIEQLEKWDSSYYSEKLKQKLFDLDDEQLKPYFKLENVLKGVFRVTEKLFGLRFEAVDDVDKYHEEVVTYRVLDRDNRSIALFYADFHPRAGKRGGAWMTSYKPQYRKDGENFRPHISNVCNFTRSTDTKPSLLSFREVTTLFHEFGHALHGMLADTTYPSLSGTSVYWDFVELPSQLLENWCYEKEALALFAVHHETGESIPMDLIEKIKATVTFQEGMATLRQLSFGLLDMAWHASDPSAVTNVKDHENQAFKATQLFPDTPETCMSTAFSHIFQGGYSSGYYSYKWAEVLDADAFDYFKERGIFNQEIARKLHMHVLAKGGTEKPMDLYVRFRGRKPQMEALLKRAGLLKKSA